jgi:hypothetical protein
MRTSQVPAGTVGCGSQLVAMKNTQASNKGRRGISWQKELTEVAKTGKNRHAARYHWNIRNR